MSLRRNKHNHPLLDDREVDKAVSLLWQFYDCGFEDSEIPRMYKNSQPIYAKKMTDNANDMARIIGLMLDFLVEVKIGKETT